MFNLQIILQVLKNHIFEIRNNDCVWMFFKSANLKYTITPKEVEIVWLYGLLGYEVLLLFSSIVLIFQVGK